MRISPLTPATTRATVTTPPTVRVAAEEPRETSLLSRAAHGAHRGAVAALGWTVGSAVGLIGFAGNLAPGAGMGLRRALGDNSYSEFQSRSDRSDCWTMLKFTQTALLGAVATLAVGGNPFLGAVIGAVLRVPLNGLASHRHLDYEMNMAVEAQVPCGNVLTGAARGALAAAVTGWKSGLNNVRAVVSGLAGTAEERGRGVDLLYYDFGREMSPEGRADRLRAKLAQPEHGPAARTRLLEKALHHTSRIYESANTFISREQQHDFTLRAWADGLRAAPSGAWSRMVPQGKNQELLALHRTLTERVDADLAYPAFERFLRRHADDAGAAEKALADFQAAVPRLQAGESLDSATLDRDARAVLGLEKPAERGEVVAEPDGVRVGEIWLPRK